MYFQFSDQQVTFRDAIRRALDVEMARQSNREGEGARALWQLAGAQGWLGIMLPEECGGLGLGLCDALILYEELGQVLAPGPFLANSVLLPAFVTSCSSTGPLDALSSSVLAGESVLALGEVSDRGTIYFDHPGLATHVLVAPAGKNALAIRSIGNAKTRDRKAFDPTQPLAEIMDIDDCELLAETADCAAAHRICDAGRVAAAAEIIGCCEAILRKTVDYAGVRHQFGQPIGSFQAIKHRLANAYIRLENARTSVYYAAWAWDNSTAQAELAADVAAACAGEMGPYLVGECLQVHGGISFTWESGLHLHLRRVQRLSRTLGTPRRAWRSIAERVLRDDASALDFAAGASAAQGKPARQASDAV